MIRHIGPPLIFQRCWELTGFQHVPQQLLKGRYEFPIERALVRDNGDVLESPAVNRRRTRVPGLMAGEQACEGHP